MEDHAPQTHLAIRKLEEQLTPLRLLLAIEALVAAQACDLRGARPDGNALFDAVRAVAPPLMEDRAPGPDADRVAACLDAGLAVRLREAAPAAALALLGGL